LLQRCNKLIKQEMNSNSPFFNLPETITFTNGDEVQYLYDATGCVLRKTFSQGGEVSEKTDYLGGIEIDGDGNWIIYNDEGRLLFSPPQIEEGPGVVWQILLRDHQGSTRVVLNPHPEDLEFTATMESELIADEEEWFGNLDTRVTMVAANHTPGGNEAARLNSNTPAGPSLVLAVYPGDVVELETYAYYENFTPNGTLGTTAMIAGIAGAFGGVSGGTEGQQMMFTVVNDALALFGFLGDEESSEPQAYLNYILFDKNMNAADFGFSAVSSSADMSQELLQLQVTATKRGYLFIYTSNESNSADPVYFDDLKATLHPGKVDAAYDYYPFGLPTTESWERVAAPVVDRKYQGQFSTFEKETHWHRFKSRMYDAQIGRWLRVDPVNQYNSPYLGMGNNPTAGVDPNGRIFIDKFIAGSFKSLWTGDDFFESGWETIENSLMIRAGLFTGGGERTASRFTKEFLNTMVGFVFAETANNFWEVHEIEYFGGATVMSVGDRWGGMTIGSYIIGDETIEADPGNVLFQHEYGHYLQSQEFGILYLPFYGIPSLLDSEPDNRDHDFHPVEQDANYRAFLYFNENVPGFTAASNSGTGGWDFFNNPLDRNGNFVRGTFWDYNNQADLLALNNLRLRPNWYDYIWPLGGNLGGIGGGIINAIDHNSWRR
jgi:RHS repeat-associated protein